jgi:16S rRNA (uracil1498-N3)-methyltransferase
MAIGPEGDFTTSEFELAVAAGFVGASLSANRLRSETAALAAVLQSQLK